MADRESSFVVDFQGTGSSLQAFLGAMKKDVRTTIADMQSASDGLRLFEKAQQDAAKASAALENARIRVESLKKAYDVGPLPKGLGTALAKDIALAEKAFASASKAVDKANTALENSRNAQRAAGAAASLLAAEQRKVGEEMAKQAVASVAAQRAAEKLAESSKRLAQEQTAVALSFQANKDFLGFKQLRDVQPEIAKVRAAYEALRASGNLSTKELAAASQLAQTRVAELRSQVTGLGQAAKVGGANLVGMFQNSVLPALGLAATFATLVTGTNAAVEAAKRYEQRLAEIGTVTKLTRGQLDELGVGARALARDLGVDVDAALRGIFDLIRSGVPAENALEALRVAAVASKASIADLGDGVKAADALISGFGADVGDLGSLLDAVVEGAKNGGATLKEFGENAGPLLAIARAANVPFNDLIATLTVMVDATGNAGQSFGDLGKIIRNLNTTEAREKLRGLGIEGTSLVDIFRQIGERGLALDQILELGVASTKSAAGVAALTSNAGQLPAVLERVGASSGVAAQNLRALFDSPGERSARFNAQLNEASINIGNMVGSGSRLQSVATQILFSFNLIPTRAKQVAEALKDPNASLIDLYGNFLRTNSAAEASRVALEKTASGLQGTGDRIDRLAASLQLANDALRDLVPRLLADIQALQQASARDIADAQARADAEIAALDRAGAARARTAAETLAIQTKLAEERLAIIVKAEADVNKAVEKAITARSAVARKAGEDEKKIAADNAQIRINALAPVLAQYQAHYNALVQQAQAFAAKQASIEGSRVELNRAIEAEIRSIRLEGLSGLDQFVEKNKEVNRLISEGRRAAAQGDTEAAKQFFQQAIQESKGLATVINADGVVIVTALQARTAKTQALKGVADAVNESLGDQGDAAKRGALATNAAIDLVLPKLNDLKNRYDDLKRDVDAGLQFKAKLDQDSVAVATATLDELAKPRETILTVHVRRVEENAAGGLVGTTTTGFARGGAVGQRRAVGQRGEGWRAVQAFAGGGPVFRIPRLSAVAAQQNQLAKAWQPALSRGSLVRAYASGGPVFRIPPSMVSGVTQEEPSPAISRAVLKGRRVLRSFARGFATGGPVLSPASKHASSSGLAVAAGTHAHSGFDMVRDILGTPKAAARVDQDEEEENNGKDKPALGGRVTRRFLTTLVRSVASVPLPGLVRLFARGGPVFRISARKIPDAEKTGQQQPSQRDAMRAPATSIFRALTRLPSLGKVLEQRDDDDTHQALRPRQVIRAFASGGPVFRIPRWNKVPGIGDDDTQPAALRSGSYVIRKRASKYYGDGLMRALALARMPVKRFAIGGKADETRWDPFWQRELHNEKQPTTRKDGTTIFYKADGTPEGAFWGDVKAGTIESQRDFQAEIFREPDLPKDARQLERLIIGYSDAVVVAARQIDGSQYWGPAIRALTIDRKDHEQRPTAEKLAVILRRARGIGLNLGITTSVRQGFDVDGRRFHKRAAKAPAGLANARLYSYDFYARGGGLRDTVRAASERFRAGFNSRRDTVRALLTPGEFVINPDAVKAATRRFGSGFLNSLNQMQIPRAALAGVSRPPDIQRFAEGGLVGDTAAGRRILGGDSDAGRRLLAGEVSEIGKRLLAVESAVGERVLHRTFENHFTIQAGGYVDEAWVRRFIIPVLDDISKRKG